MTIEGVVLDHVAHAVHHWQDGWNRYAVDFGAEWSSGGPGPGFAPGQVRFANGARIELLMPCDIETNDFLDRFLARTGPGPHHLTFKLPDLAAGIEEARRIGLEPMGIDLSDPQWMEAFLHPKQATGVVVQLAQAPHHWASPSPDGYPTARRQRRDSTGPVAAASLRRVTHAVADIDSAISLFVDLLGATVVGEGARSDHQWLDLGWDCPLGLRLVSPTDPSASGALSQWIDGSAGRIHHLDLTADEPEGLPGAQPKVLEVGPDEGDEWVISADANEGLCLVVSAH